MLQLKCQISLFNSLTQKQIQVPISTSNYQLNVQPPVRQQVSEPSIEHVGYQEHCFQVPQRYHGHTQPQYNSYPSVTNPPIHQQFSCMLHKYRYLF